MKAKYYPLKFGLVGIVVAVCIWSLYARGLNEGIDIRGGHTLQYEIQRSEGDPHDLVQEAIGVLKRRVDPQGLAALEWRPVGGNRFEVRMPTSGPESQQRKNAYDLAMEDLQGSNIQRSEIRRVEQVSPDEREKEIRKLSGADERLEKLLGELVQAYQVTLEREKTFQQKKAELESARKKSDGKNLERLEKELEEAQDARDLASLEHRKKYGAVLDTNIRQGELEAILENFVSLTEEKALRKVGKKKEIDRRRKMYEVKLQELREAHPTRVVEIDRVVERYEGWAIARRPLGDPGDLRRLIAKAGVLEFRIVPELPTELWAARTTKGNEPRILSYEEYSRYVSNPEYLEEKDRRTGEKQRIGVTGQIREDPKELRKRNSKLLWFPLYRTPKEFGGGSTIIGEWAGGYYVLLYNQLGDMMLRQGDRWKLTGARRDVDNMNRRAVNFTFDSGGAKLFFRLTGAHIGHLMAILLDDEVYSSPVIQSTISDRGQITGNFSEAEQRELVRTLAAGTLPARVKFLSQNTFGPSIGRNNRNLAIRAAYIGMIAVAGFMLVYYLLAGFVANVALMLNILLVLGVMSLLDAVFTLPGIAGVILTIGIAVDANVLIFERLRREQVGRESIRLAVADTYRSTWPVIRDANITTLITCLILGWVGTEELRGFAITLGLGVVFSMFCALFVTRWILELLSENRRNRPFALPRLIREPKWRWVSKRYYFWGISIVLIGIGIGSLIWQGGDIWGIEFSAGTKAVLQFKDDALIRDPRTGNMELTNDGLVRELFSARATQGGYEKLRATARVEERIDPAKTDHFLRDYDLDGDEKVSLAEFQRAKKSADFLKLVDGRGDGDGFLTRDEIRAFIPATAYQISTTETDVGLIRAVATQAFGAALTRRTSCTYEMVEGAALRELSAEILPGSDGLTKISEAPTPGSISPKDAYPQYQDVLLDYAGGVVFVVRNVNPAISTAELKQRIREMRSQPDFAGQSSETEVLPFQSAGEDRFASFAVLVAPPNVLVTEDEDTWKEFAKTQKELLGAALSREEAMVASNFDAVIAGETAQRAVVAILLSWGGIVLYLALSFRGFQWGFAAVVCLVHDVVIVVGLIAASGWLHQTFIGRALGIDSFKIDLAMVAAMLTVIGYSVNDTIVVFGHVRERPAIGRGRGWSTRTVDWSVVSRALDDAINRTFSRTMVTSLTTGMVVFIMYVWGGPGIHAFNFALLAGVIFGTYSSIAVAAPLLLGLRGALAARIRREPGAKET